MQNTSNIRMPKFFNNFSTFHFHFHNQHEELANIKTKNEGIDKELKLAQQRMNEGNQFRKEKREKEKIELEKHVQEIKNKVRNYNLNILRHVECNHKHPHGICSAYDIHGDKIMCPHGSSCLNGNCPFKHSCSNGIKCEVVGCKYCHHPRSIKAF